MADVPTKGADQYAQGFKVSYFFQHCMMISILADGSDDWLLRKGLFTMIYNVASSNRILRSYC
jgi:hypothetical protein